MKKFKDSEGREWSFRITLGSIRRVKEARNINLLDIASEAFGAMFDKLADPIALGEMLFILCMDEAEKRSLSESQFYDLFVGDVIETARVALLEEIVDFFPGAPRRQALRTMIEKFRELEKVRTEMTAQRVQMMDVKNLQAQLEKVEATKMEKQSSSSVSS